MTQGNSCGICHAQVSNEYVCINCTHAYRTALTLAAITYDDVNGRRMHCLLDELDVMLSRQSRMGRQGTAVKRSGIERPLPWDNRASDARDAIETAVMLAWQHGAPSRRDAVVVHGPRFAARLLFADLTRLIAKPVAVQAIRALFDANTSAVLVIDRPPDSWYAGQCSASVDVSAVAPEGICLFDLYALPDASVVRCTQCGTQHDVKQRRAVLLDAASDVLASATEIARAVALFGEAVTAANIHQWASRKRLVQRGVNGSGQPLYRVGDVIDLARMLAVRRATRPPRPRTAR